MRKTTVTIGAAILLIAMGCSESDSGGQEVEVSPPLIQDIPVKEVQDQVEKLLRNDEYDQAVVYLRSIDIHTLAASASVKGGTRYWAVMEDGVSVPGLDDFDLSIQQLIDISRSCWVIPGTSDTQSSGGPQAWQRAATDTAAIYNESLYRSRSDDTE